MYDDEKLEVIFAAASNERAELLRKLDHVAQTSDATAKTVQELATLLHEMDRRLTVVETKQNEDGTHQDIRDIRSDVKVLFSNLSNVSGEVKMVKEKAITNGLIVAAAGAALVNVGIAFLT